MTTSYPGVSPEVVETSITAPLEHYFGQISGLTSMGSVSDYGTSQITLQFNLSRPIDAAAQDVQAQINGAEGWIPIALLPGPPTYREVNPADTPVIILALTSDTLPLQVVDDFAQTAIVQKLSQVAGMGNVTIEGGQTRAVRLQANPAQLAGLGLSLEDVRRAVSAATIDNPKGSLEGPQQAFTLPVSLVATFGAMALCGFSFDNLSLMALTVASGFVVDDAIVMIENIVRYIEAGEAPLPAALKGARQIGFTVVSLTVSLVAVFIPLLLMGGIVGRLFREFAITLSLAVIVSAFVSLTLTPMMCARLLREHHAEAKPNALFRWSEHGFDALCAGYVRGLDWVLLHRRATMAGFLLTLGATAWLAAAVHKGFLPLQDTGLLIGTTDAPQDISFAAMAQRQQAMADIIARDPAVATVDSFVGAGTTNATLNSGRIYIEIGSPDHRAPAPVTMQRLRQATV